MKTINKTLLTFLLTTLFSIDLWAQQDIMVSQQIFSRMNINPAGTGNMKNIDAFLLGRLQWLGVDNTPKTALLNVGYYNEGLRSSFGLTTNYDNIGIGNSQTTVDAVYAYHLDLSEKYILSLGLSAGMNIGSFDPYANDLRDAEPDLSSYVKDKETEISPDINIGAELSSKRLMFGLSVTHLLESEPTTFKRGRHIYAYGRCLIPLNQELDLAPMVSYIHQHQVNEAEIGSTLFIKRTFWGGLTWKPDLKHITDMSIMCVNLGMEVNIFRIGYAYSLNMGSANNLPSNTHEILLSAHF